MKKEIVSLYILEKKKKKRKEQDTCNKDTL